VHLSSLFHVLLWNLKAICWFLNEECVVHVSCWVTLWLEKCIEVPEGAFNVPVSRHFLETHFQEDFLELLTNLHERMTVTTMAHCSLCIEIIVFKLLVLPIARPQHFRGQVSLQV